MTFGQQPQNNNANGFNGQPYGQNQYNPNQNCTGSTARIRTVRTNTSTRRRTCMRRAPGGHHSGSGDIPWRACRTCFRHPCHGEMTIGLLCHRGCGYPHPSHWCSSRHPVAGVIGAWAPFVVEIVIAIYLAPALKSIKLSTARVKEIYVYAAIMGFAKHHFHGV